MITRAREKEKETSLQEFRDGRSILSLSSLSARASQQSTIHHSRCERETVNNFFIDKRIEFELLASWSFNSDCHYAIYESNGSVCLCMLFCLLLAEAAQLGQN